MSIFDRLNIDPNRAGKIKQFGLLFVIVGAVMVSFILLKSPSHAKTRNADLEEKEASVNFATAGSSLKAEEYWKASSEDDIEQNAEGVAKLNTKYEQLLNKFTRYEDQTSGQISSLQKELYAANAETTRVKSESEAIKRAFDKASANKITDKKQIEEMVQAELKKIGSETPVERAAPSAPSALPRIGGATITAPGGEAFNQTPQPIYGSATAGRERGIVTPTAQSTKVSEEDFVIDSFSEMDSEANKKGKAGQKSANNTKKEQPDLSNYMPAATKLPATLITGVAATTRSGSAGNPEPLNFVVTGDGFLPNKYRKQTKLCEVIAAGYGDRSSERVIVRTERISCVLKDNRIIEATIDAWVTDDIDGKNGMSGTLVSRATPMLKASAAAGVLDGLGGYLSGSSQTTSQSALGTISSLNPSMAAEAALGGAISQSSDRLQKYFIEQADAISPVVEVSPGRGATIILKKGLIFETVGYAS